MFYIKVFNKLIEYLNMKNPDRHFKNSIYEQFSRIGSAISSPKRLELLDILCQGPRTVEVLAKETGMTIANTSQHLQVLRIARLVETEKEGLFVTYRLADKLVCDFFHSLSVLAKSRLAEIEQLTRRYFEDREAMEPIDRTVLMKRVREGTVTVLDVRPKEEYQAGHIPGAISIPLKELEKHLSELPKEQEIVAYCRGPYCVLSIKAVELLRSKGYTSIRLEDGVWEWRNAGLPVEIDEQF